MLVNYDKLKKAVINTSVPKPLSGTLSGHSAGEPFDKHVYSEIKKQFPDKTFRQYEYLNYLFTKNPTAIGIEARNDLFNFRTPALLELACVGQRGYV